MNTMKRTCYRPSYCTGWKKAFQNNVNINVQGRRVEELTNPRGSIFFININLVRLVICCKLFPLNDLIVTVFLFHKQRRPKSI